MPKGKKNATRLEVRSFQWVKNAFELDADLYDDETEIDDDLAEPFLEWEQPAEITAGTVLGPEQLCAETNSDGVVEYDPEENTELPVGTHELTARVAETQYYTSASATVSIKVSKAIPTFEWTAPVAVAHGTLPTTAGIVATTTSDGELTYTPKLDVAMEAADTLEITVVSAETPRFVRGEAKVTIKVEKLASKIEWAEPASIVYGTLLGPDQRLATLTIGEGDLAYAEAVGQKLPGGEHDLKVTYAGNAKYLPTSATVKLKVTPAKPVLTWANPPAVWENTPLTRAAHLTATTNGDGALTFDPLETTPAALGLTALKVTSAATGNYEEGTASVPIKVLRQAEVNSALKANPAQMLQLKNAIGEEKLLQLCQQLSLAELTQLTGGAGTLASLTPLLRESSVAQIASYVAELGPGSTGALIAEGFSGDAAQFEAVKAKLGGNFQAFRQVITETGVAGDPRILGKLIKSVMKGGADALKAFTDAYAGADDRNNLKAVLTGGGAGSQPEILSGLLEHGCDGNPAKLKTFCTAFKDAPEQAKLKDLLTKGGLGGQQGQGDRLGHIYKTGLGEDPARLKELHTAFNGGDVPGADLAKLRRTVDAFGSGEGVGGEQTGKRFGRVMGRLASPTELRTVFYEKVQTRTRGGASRAAQDRLEARPEVLRSLDSSTAARELAKAHPAVAAVTAAATGAANAAASTAAATLAGALLDPKFIAASESGAEAASRAAAMAVDPAATAQATAGRITGGIALANVGRTDAEIANLVNAARLAANQAATLATTAANNARLALPVQPPPPNPAIAATPLQIETLGNAAKAAMTRAAEATDAAIVTAAITAATLASEALAAAVTIAAKAKLHGERAPKYQAAGALIAPGAVPNPTTLSDATMENWCTTLDASAAATLNATIASSPQALAKTLLATQARLSADAKAGDSRATPTEVQAARDAAKTAQEEAANEVLAAAVARVNTIRGAAPNPIVLPYLMALLGDVDALSTAATGAPDGAPKTNARTLADAAYAFIKTAGPLDPALAGGPAKRKAISGACAIQQMRSKDAMSLEGLLRNAATFENTRPIVIAPGDAPVLPGGVTTDMVHICGRHTRSDFTFGGAELASFAKVIRGKAVKAKVGGHPHSAAEHAAVADAKRDKKQSFFPEGMPRVSLKEFIEAALADANGGGGQLVKPALPGHAGGIPPARRPLSGASIAALTAGLFVQVSGLSVGMGGGPLGISTATMGVKGAGATFTVDQFYPEGGARLETIYFADMHAIAKGLKY